MLERSDSAPAGWRIDQTEAAVRSFTLEADVYFVLFQELPGLVPYLDTHDMVPTNTKGQSGDVATLARRDLMPQITASRLDNAVLMHIASLNLTIANVHLPSGRGRDHDRLEIIKRIQSTSKTKHLAIIGDTNTRTAEEGAITGLGLRGARPPEPTWNGRLSKYRQDDRTFTAYFTRAFHSTSLEIASVKVWSQPTEQRGHTFHLSDHFAMSVQITILSPA
jgi:endonuclease/exonuclease/phosphatase family metal-dependent hydrolase